MPFVQIALIGWVLAIQTQTTLPLDIQKALAPVSGAESITWSNNGVTYEVNAQFPATPFVTGLGVRLTGMGWKALDEDIFNPGLSTSQGHDWSNFIDGRTEPNRRVYQWLGQWVNSRGDVIVFGLTYRAETAEPESTPDKPLHV